MWLFWWIWWFCLDHRKDLPFVEINIHFDPTAFQVVVAKVNNTTFVSIYISPNARITYQSLQYLVEQLEHPFIIMGDLNAHSPTCGSAFIRGNGNHVDRSIEELDLYTLNNGEATLIHPLSGNKSIIDLVISSPVLYYDLNLYVLSDTYGSNHYPVLTEYNNHLKITPKTNIHAIKRFPNWKKNDWISYKDILENKSAQLDNYSNMTDKYKIFCDSILDVSCKSTPAPRIPKIHIPSTRKYY